MYIHKVTHSHAYGTDTYVFTSDQEHHIGEEDFQKNILALLHIEYDAEAVAWNQESLAYEFNINPPIYKP